MHHLIDPRTSQSSASDLAQVTVVARCAELAEVLAKAAFIVGARESRRMLRDFPDAGALLVRNNGAWEGLGALEVDDA